MDFLCNYTSKVCKDPMRRCEDCKDYEIRNTFYTVTDKDIHPENYQAQWRKNAKKMAKKGLLRPNV